MKIIIDSEKEDIEIMVKGFDQDELCYALKYMLEKLSEEVEADSCKVKREFAIIMIRCFFADVDENKANLEKGIAAIERMAESPAEKIL